MATIGPDYSGYVFGSNNFTTASAPQSTIGGWIQTVPGALGTTATSVAAQQLYPQGLQQAPFQYNPEQMQMFLGIMLDALRYGQTTWRTGPVEAPRALETKALTSADRAELDKRLPF